MNEALLSHTQAVETQEAFIKANEKRDYTIYEKSMDAALIAKAHSILPHFGPIPQNSVIVDAGSGTGALAELVAYEWRENRVKVYALDISHELQEHAKNNQSTTQLVYGDASEQNFPNNSVHVKYFSTSGHEIETFGGEGRMEQAVKSTYNELVPGGRIIIRDFAKPSQTEPILMKLVSNVGINDVSLVTYNGVIDYTYLSPRALFDRFHKEFQGGNAFEYDLLTIDGQEYIRLDPVMAHEFYLRKDYTANWHQEIKETYTYWDEKEAVKVLTDSGYTDVQVIPDPNEFILTNRLRGKIELFEITDEGLSPIDFPSTHMVVLGTKPLSDEPVVSPDLLNEITAVADYEKIKQTIIYERDTAILQIGDNEFIIDTEVPVMTGSKKQTFHLKNMPDQVLKVVRQDGFNDHNMFKAMYQAITREHVLDEYGVSHLSILDVDREGPPYRYYLQQAVSENSICATELIKTDSLTEEDIKQMANVVNAFELKKTWQLDTNPFNWYKVTAEDGSTDMVYVDGKVYSYDEAWEFRQKGLLQWTDKSYVSDVKIHTAKIPTRMEYEKMRSEWANNQTRIAQWWKQYLSPRLQPN